MIRTNKLRVRIMVKELARVTTLSEKITLHYHKNVAKEFIKIVNSWTWGNQCKWELISLKYDDGFTTFEIDNEEIQYPDEDDQILDEAFIEFKIVGFNDVDDFETFAKMFKLEYKELNKSEVEWDGEDA